MHLNLYSSRSLFFQARGLSSRQKTSKQWLYLFSSFGVRPLPKQISLRNQTKSKAGSVLAIRLGEYLPPDPAMESGGLRG